ncbi:hypothetical protein LPJ73_003023, partial [Coemansia sp. RSA 2703]
MSGSTAAHTWQTLPTDVLRQVFAWMHPLGTTPRAAITSSTLRDLASFQRTSAQVCQHWRHTALPLYLGTAIVYVTVHLAPTRATPATFTVASNIALLQAHPKGTSMAHTVVLCISGPVPLPVTLLRALNSCGVLDTVWPRVHTLRHTVDRPTGFAQQPLAAHDVLKDVKRLNMSIAKALPALRHVDYTDVYCGTVYSSFPLSALLCERSNELRSIRVFTDTPPKWSKDVLRVPVLHTHIVDTPRAPRRPPRMVAGVLVELTLTVLAASRLWEAFEPAEHGGGLEFTCLRSLTLMFFWRYGQGRQQQRVPADSESDESDEEDDISDETGYMQSSRYGKPRFPCLARLGIHRFPGSLRRLLGVFGASPVRALVLAGLLSEISATDVAACTSFSDLRALDLRLIGRSATEEERAEYALTLQQVTQLNGLSSLALSVEPFADDPFTGMPNQPQIARTLRLLHLAPLHTLDVLIPYLPHMPYLLDLRLTLMVQPDDPTGNLRSLAALLHDLRSSEDVTPVNVCVSRLVVEIDVSAQVDALGKHGSARDAAARGVLRQL